MGTNNPPHHTHTSSACKQRPTTSDLFLRLAKTERARSAKADNVFRKLRHDMKFGNQDTQSIEPTRPLLRNASLEMKIAARNA